MLLRIWNHASRWRPQHYNKNAIDAISLSNEHPDPKFIGCSYIYIYNNTFYRNGNGVYIRDGNGEGPEIKAKKIYIYDNEFSWNSPYFSYEHRSDCHAIGTQSVVDSEFYDNYIHDCQSMGNAGIYIWSRSNYTSIRNRVTGNIILNVSNSCLGQGSVPKNNVFENNICNGAEWGIMTAGISKIVGNQFLNIRSVGIYLKNEFPIESGEKQYCISRKAKGLLC